MKTYLRHSVRNVIDVKELIALEFLDFEGKYRDYVEAHDFWELCYVTCGEITLFLEREGISVSEGELVLVAPNEKHSYYSAGGNSNRAFVVCFDCFSQMLAPISNCLFPTDRVQVTCMEQVIEECGATFRMNEKEHLEILAASRFGGQQALMIQLEYLLINMVRRKSGAKNSDIVFFSEENFYADLVSVMHRFLRENVCRKLSLEDICSRFNYSRSFLCKTFKEQTGETLITCFNRLKMEEAKRLLAETTDSVTAIAERLGIREVKYFDVMFKKHTGLTPNTYRERNRKKIYQKEDAYEQSEN